MKSRIKYAIAFALILSATLLLSHLYIFRIDLTSDKRYSIQNHTISLVKELKEPLHVTLYLNGNLNPGFTRLRSSAVELMEELHAKSGRKIQIRFVDLSSPDKQRDHDIFQQFADAGVEAVSVYEKDKNGKVIQNIVYPWLQLEYKNKSTFIHLLKNKPGLSGEENLNISIESLEFEVADAISKLTNRKVEKIAFLEGHGELNEDETADISRKLSHYFQIDRGTLGTESGVLDDYKVVVISRPTEPFSESDKFILDQYIMQGGSILWLIDPVRMDFNMLSSRGETPALAYELNLSDLLFRYGIRFTQGLILDTQCTQLPLNIAPESEHPEFAPFPFYYAPLLLTSSNHPITRNLAPVRALFASPIELVGNNEKVTSSILLAGSKNGGIIRTPANISLDEMQQIIPESELITPHIPVAVALEGIFQSAYTNRVPPPDVITANRPQLESNFTRQIFIADGDIIRNEFDFKNDSIVVLPLGYDRYSGVTYANSELIINTVLYLSGNHKRIELRSRELPLRLLDQKLIQKDRFKLQMINIGLPLVLLLLFTFIYSFFRRRKYGKRTAD